MRTFALSIVISALLAPPIAAIAADPPVAPAGPSARQRVQGSEVTLVPPEGWTRAADFAGFENKAIAGSIMVASIPATWAEAQPGLSRDALASRGVEIIVHESTVVGEAPAVAAEFFQDRTGVRMRTFVLAFAAAPKVTAMVNMSTSDHSPEAAAALREAMKSVRWEPRTDADPFEGYPFAMDIPAGLKPSANMGNTLLLTNSATGAINPLSDAIVLAARRPQPGPIEDPRTYISNAITSGQSLRTQGDPVIQEIEVDGLEGFEARGRLLGPNGDTIDMNVLILFEDNATWEVIASTPAAKRGGPSIETLAAASRTLRRKDPFASP